MAEELITIVGNCGGCICVLAFKVFVIGLIGYLVTNTDRYADSVTDTWATVMYVGIGVICSVAALMCMCCVGGVMASGRTGGDDDAYDSTTPTSVEIAPTDFTSPV